MAIQKISRVRKGQEFRKKIGSVQKNVHFAEAKSFRCQVGYQLKEKEFLSALSNNGARCAESQAES